MTRPKTQVTARKKWGADVENAHQLIVRREPRGQ